MTVINVAATMRTSSAPKARREIRTVTRSHVVRIAMNPRMDEEVIRATPTEEGVNSGIVVSQARVQRTCIVALSPTRVVRARQLPSLPWCSSGRGCSTGRSPFQSERGEGDEHSTKAADDLQAYQPSRRRLVLRTFMSQVGYPSMDARQIGLDRQPAP